MRVRLVVLAVVALLAAGCGSDAGDETESGGGSESVPSSSGENADQGSNAGSDQSEEVGEALASPPGDSGASFTVDGESLSGDLFSCDPSDGAGDAEPGDLELVVLSGPSEGLSIDVWHSERQGSDGALFQQTRVEVRLNRVTDVVEEYSSLFDHDADDNWTIDSDRTATLDGPPITVEGDRLMGEVILQQDVPLDATGTVAVSFDFEIPELSC